MKKALLALLGAVVALGLVVAVMRWREAVASRPRLAFANARLADAAALRIRYAGDSAILLRKDGRWGVAGDGFPADTAHLRRAFEALASLQTGEVVADSADAADLVEYGLGPSEIKRVEWENADGSRHRVELGKLSGVDYESLFWKREDGPRVYRTPGKFVWEFSSRAVDWKDTNLYYPRAPFAPGDVRSLEVEWKAADTASGGHVALTTVAYRLERKNDSDFVLTRPFAAPAARDEAVKLFRYASQFKVDFFVPGADTSAAGATLDAPFMTIRVGLKDGSERVVTAGAEVDQLYRYARHASRPEPVRVFKWRFEYFKKRGEDFEAKR